MRMFAVPFLALAAACAPGASIPTGDAAQGGPFADAGGAAGGPDAAGGAPIDAAPGGTPDAALALHGFPPATPHPLPSFSGVVNYDGTPRTPADLTGHPTVIWFYPAALTSG